MAKETGNKSKVSKVVDALSVATAIPVFGEMGSKIFAFGKELWKDETISGAIKAEIGKALGNTTDQAAKDPGDEHLYGFALNTLDPAQKKEAKSFEIALRKMDAKKCESYVLWVAKIVKLFEKQIKISVPSPSNPKEKKETTATDITEGLLQGALFIVDVMDNIGATAEETFAARVHYLQWSNAFSLVSEKKASVIGKVTTAIKNDGQNAGTELTKNIDQLTAWIKSKHR